MFGIGKTWFPWPWYRPFLPRQYSVCGVTIGILTTGIWWRVRRWEYAGGWLTWSTERRFGERFGYEFPFCGIWYKNKFRIVVFPLEKQRMYYDASQKTETNYGND
jgi:hypothetical protein